MLEKFLCSFSANSFSSRSAFLSLFHLKPFAFATCTGTSRRLTEGVRERGEGMAIRLVQFQLSNEESSPRVGVELGDGGSVVDVTNIDSSIPKDMRSFLESWDSSLSATFR